MDAIIQLLHNVYHQTIISLFQTTPLSYRWLWSLPLSVLYRFIMIVFRQRLSNGCLELKVCKREHMSLWFSIFRF